MRTRGFFCNFRIVSYLRCADQAFTLRRLIFTIAMLIGLVPCISSGVNAATFDLLPNSMFAIEVTGDILTPSSITITEHMQPSLVELMSASGATGFSGYIFNTDVYQAGSSNNGFAIPHACIGPGDCGLLSSIVECVCGIDIADGYVSAINGTPVTISVTDTSRYFLFADNFSTVGLMTNVGFLPFSLRLTVEPTDGLGINFISGPISPSFATVTPIPATLPLFASGLGGLGLLVWRRKRNAAALVA